MAHEVSDDFLLSRNESIASKPGKDKKTALSSELSIRSFKSDKSKNSANELNDGGLGTADASKNAKSATPESSVTRSGTADLDVANSTRSDKSFLDTLSRIIHSTQAETETKRRDTTTSFFSHSRKSSRKSTEIGSTEKIAPP